MKNLKILLLLIGAITCFQCEESKETSQKTVKLERQNNEGVVGANGMVVTAHPLATKVGLEVLKNGGNAFDAAVAVQYALAVVLPKAGNIGGGGYMVYRTSDGEKGALDFRETAPAAASRDMFIEFETDSVLRQKALLGHLAACIPGTVDGMEQIHKKFGGLTFTELIQPAIDFAKHGFAVTDYDASTFNNAQEQFRAVNDSTMIFLKDSLWVEGDSLIQKDLAKTLERIRDNGRAGFYEGETAQYIVDEMQSGDGIITKEDLKNYKSVWREPIEGIYRDSFNIVSMPPSSSGGIIIVQQLKGSDAYDFEKMGHNSVETVHVMTELQRRAYADRAEHMGDMDFYDVPIDMLLDDEYIASRNSSIQMDKATPSNEIKAGSVEKIESLETTHFSIVDKEGNAVSITTTLVGYFGCKVLVDNAGFFLNNEMNNFSLKPGFPNIFGLVGGEANSIAPGKRMLSSMSPTIIEKNGDLYMVVGTPGGSTIINVIYENIVNVIDHGMTMQEAVDAKKHHSQWLPDQIVVENGALDSLALEKLKSMGHAIRITEQLGRTEAILVRPDGSYEGAADNTRTGDAVAEGY
ncbi:gamma-glutamyltransferase [Flagellimonas zhangzhouensis]|uniref:Glutathione hydrolase proenzyme n=1 Tax=Flagellimonas zhangzhouensis TaxID=1073328 RepID=A0A1H2U0H9_9FLAO|nr:gamma-glutamyltransferase [Allomuricauda zhangzhouensis]SDQ21498.1 gamma-glutamyltranspeptidase / glutathione hydrolase [Allomuricauda zhangzhouensis]SDW49686.1 gamma-glutamyltranspeptidase / glutathione hydrolase [Allomuricauda zhangzhouensis]